MNFCPIFFVYKNCEFVRTLCRMEFLAKCDDRSSFALYFMMLLVIFQALKMDKKGRKHVGQVKSIARCNGKFSEMRTLNNFGWDG